MPFFILLFTDHHQGLGHYLREPFCMALMSNEIKPVMIPTVSSRSINSLQSGEVCLVCGFTWNFEVPPSIPTIHPPFHPKKTQ